MVSERRVEVETCPICGDCIEDGDFAEHLADHYPPSTEIKSYFKCDICPAEYEKHKQAEHCEADHKKQNDIFFQEYEIKLNQEKLAEAASLPGQTKLIGE